MIAPEFGRSPQLLHDFLLALVGGHEKQRLHSSPQMLADLGGSEDA